MLKKFTFLLLLPIFLGGKPLGLQIRTPYCPCLDVGDTTTPDSMWSIMAPIIAETVDSFRAAKQSQLDSVNVIKDSLTVELKQLKREKRKRSIVGKIDHLPKETWVWEYWIYPDGTRQFRRVKIYSINGTPPQYRQ